MPREASHDGGGRATEFSPQWVPLLPPIAEQLLRATPSFHFGSYVGDGGFGWLFLYGFLVFKHAFRWFRIRFVCAHVSGFAGTGPNTSRKNDDRQLKANRQYVSVRVLISKCACICFSRWIFQACDLGGRRSGLVTIADKKYALRRLCGLVADSVPLYEDTVS